MNDTIDASPEDSIIHYLDASAFLWAKCHEAFFLNEKGNTEAAYELLEQLPSIYHLNEEQQAEVQNYLTYLTLLNDSESQGRTMYQPDSTQIQTLQQLAQNSTGLAGIYAMNILIALKKYSYQEPYILPDSSLKESRIKWIRSKPYKMNSLKLYPNPAHNYFIAEYTLENGKGSAIFEITDYSGNKLLSKHVAGNKNFLVIPVQNFVNGMYICNLIFNNKKILTGKIVINK